MSLDKFDKRVFSKPDDAGAEFDERWGNIPEDLKDIGQYFMSQLAGSVENLDFHLDLRKKMMANPAAFMQEMEAEEKSERESYFATLTPVEAKEAREDLEAGDEHRLSFEELLEMEDWAIEEHTEEGTKWKEAFDTLSNGEYRKCIEMLEQETHDLHMKASGAREMGVLLENKFRSEAGENVVPLRPHSKRYLEEVRTLKEYIAKLEKLAKP